MNVRSVMRQGRSVRKGACIVALCLLAIGTVPMPGFKFLGVAPTVAAGEKTRPASQLFYVNNFAAPAGPEWSSSSTDTTPCGEQFLGQFGTGTVSLSLGNLPTHTNLTVSFDLYIIRAWSGSVPGTESVTEQAPDIWDLSVAGGPDLLHTTFSNNGNDQAYPGTFPDADNAAQSGASEVNTLGYTFDYGPELGGVAPNDSVYHINESFAHTASSIEFDFSANLTPAGASITQKSWGITNLSVVGAVSDHLDVTSDLTFDTKVSPAAPEPGATVEFTTTVKNKGPKPATDITAEISLDQSAIFLSMATSQGTFIAPTPNCPFSTVFVLLGTIDRKQAATIKLT
ncbi:MAG TPA: CARDB domain-containing protein, partial [Blastocatellia bacterium]